MKASWCPPSGCPGLQAAEEEAWPPTCEARTAAAGPITIPWEEGATEEENPVPWREKGQALLAFDHATIVATSLPRALV